MDQEHVPRESASPMPAFLKFNAESALLLSLDRNVQLLHQRL